MGLGAWLRWPGHPLAGSVCRDQVQDPAFAPGTSEVAVGLWPFCILLFIFCPSSACVRLFLVLLVSLYDIAGGDVCPGASTAAKGPGPRSQPVS